MNQQDQNPQQTSGFRAAVIGVGARASVARHVEATGGRVVAAVDPAPQTHARAARLFGDIPVFASVAQLLASDIALDGAFVTTPDFTHADISVELLEGGVPVYLEKPLAISIEDADRILETAYRTGSKLYVGHNMRHMRVVRMMKDVIDRGEIGEVKAIWCRHFVGHGGDYYFKDWHAERDKAMSLLLQKGAHDIDVMHWLAGTSSRTVVGVGDLAVYGQVESRRDNSDRRMGDWFSTENWPPLAQQDLNPVIDVEDISMIMMRTDSGVLMSYQQCHFTPDYWRNYTVIGTEGRIENFDDGTGGEIRVWNARSDYLEKGHVRYPIEDGGDGGHGGADPLTVGEFVAFVRNGTPTDTNPLAARDAVAAGIAGALSIRSGSRPQQIPVIADEVRQYFTDHQPSRP
ncbi:MULTISPECIES: Gfo/Idh/MocA family protein [unclassified Microbacterium]|uniref:Gfo/Idh/MocA family protein n=1 Tax=unclassified Microbacterium TaxID=2609290 RepID=UPI00365B4F92